MSSPLTNWKFLPQNITARSTANGAIAGLFISFLVTTTGCGGSSDASVSAPPSSSASYFAPAVAGAGFAGSRQTFQIDHGAKTFVQYQYAPTQNDEQYIANSGSYSTLANGLLNIGLTYENGSSESGTNPGTLYSTPELGNWAVEYPGEGGFVGLLGSTLNPQQSVVPIVADTSCPSLTGSQKFQFVTLPASGDKTGTAYGSVAVSTSGSLVSLSNISQFSITGAAVNNASTTTVTSICGPTLFGQTISIPDAVTVTNPGAGTNGSVTPAATIAIAPSGFLAEDNGYTTNPVTYQNVLGAGTGAVGLPAPASALSTSALVGAQYTGFIYSSGANDPVKTTRTAIPPATEVASFGYPNTASACPAPPAPLTSSMILGGEFANNNPKANAYGNCDVGLDLGAQDPQAPGLYPHATLWIGSSFPRPASTGGYPNQSHATYSVPAVVIAGQLHGKFAIFAIALDSTAPQSVVAGAAQDWGIYLLQSN